MLVYRRDGKKGNHMSERIIRIVEQATSHGMTFTIAETLYEYGRHYVFYIDGQPDFHSTDLERVKNYMKIWM